MCAAILFQINPLTNVRSLEKSNVKDRNDLSAEAKYGSRYSPLRFAKWQGSFVVQEFILQQRGERKVAQSISTDVNIHQTLICSLTISRPGYSTESVTVKMSCKGKADNGSRDLFVILYILSSGQGKSLPIIHYSAAVKYREFICLSVSNYRESTTSTHSCIQWLAFRHF